MLMESLMDSLLGFAFFSNWLAPSFCNELVFKPVFAFKIDSVFKTFENRKWPTNNSGSVGADPLQWRLGGVGGVWFSPW